MLYTPEGTCNISLAPIIYPGGILDFGVLVPLNKQLVLCGGYQNGGNCFLYDVDTNTWSIISKGKYLHSQKGTAHQGKIYLPNSDGNHPEIFDPLTKAWSSWPDSLGLFSPDACLVSWKGFILQLGGPCPYSKNVLKYDPVSNLWSWLPASSTHDFSQGGGMVLPNDNILITYVDALNQVAEYNVTSNTWLPTVLATSNLHYSYPVILGYRTLVISGYSDVVHEYFYTNRTLVVVKESFPRLSFFSSVSTAAPANWFTKLLPTCYGVYWGTTFMISVKSICLRLFFTRDVSNKMSSSCRLK